MVIGAKLRGERVPLCVVLVGEKLSRRDLEWATTVAKQIGAGQH